MNRGDKGAALVNLAAESNAVEVPTGLSDGEYKDVVYGNTFVVENGILMGTAPPETTYIIVK